LITQQAMSMLVTVVFV